MYLIVSIDNWHSTEKKGIETTLLISHPNYCTSLTISSRWAVIRDEGDISSGPLHTAGAEAVGAEAVGDIVDDVTPDNPRRPRRMRRKNVLYQGDWWVDHGGKENE